MLGVLEKEQVDEGETRYTKRSKKQDFFYVEGKVAVGLVVTEEPCLDMYLCLGLGTPHLVALERV
jgi:hypothetical protein